MNLEKYQTIIEKVNRLRGITRREKNIFDIGGKGHYENPISDIFAFFLDPRGEHNFNELFLISLLKCLSPEDYLSIADPSLFKEVTRELRTYQGNRIDIFIEGEDWTLTIENKIRATVYNPLSDYYDFIEKEYPTKKNTFIILSMDDLIVPEEWYKIQYANLISSIKNNLGNYFLNEGVSNNFKWLILLREYLLNLENEIGDAIMDKELVDFVDHNYREINDLINYKDEYHSYIAQQCEKIIHKESANCEIEQVMHNWKWATAIRSYAINNWGKKTNIAFVVCNDQKYKIRVYIYDVEVGDLNELKKIFNDYEYWSELNETIRCFGKEKIDTREDCFSHFTLSVKRLNQFYSK